MGGDCDSGSFIVVRDDEDELLLDAAYVTEDGEEEQQGKSDTDAGIKNDSL